MLTGVGLGVAEDDERFGRCLDPQRRVLDRHRLDGIARRADRRAAPGRAALGAAPAGAVADRRGAAARALRLRSAHLPLSFCACCSIFSTACRTASGQALPSPMPRSVWSPRAWTTISVRCRYFSLVRITCAEMALSLSTRSSVASRRCRSAGGGRGDVDVTAGDVESHVTASAPAASFSSLAGSWQLSWQLKTAPSAGSRSESSALRGTSRWCAAPASALPSAGC